MVGLLSTHTINGNPISDSPIFRNRYGLGPTLKVETSDFWYLSIVELGKSKSNCSQNYLSNLK